MTEKTQYWLYRLNSSVKLRLQDTEILDAEEELSHVYSSINKYSEEYERVCRHLDNLDKVPLEDYIVNEHRILSEKLSCAQVDLPVHQPIYYAVPGMSLYFSLTTHGGTLTDDDVKKNIRDAIYRSNECGEDWIADLKMSWYERSGMIFPTDEELLFDDDEIDSYVEDIVNVWRSEKSGKTEYCHNNIWGTGEKLMPLDKDQLVELEDRENWTLSTLLSEIPYDSPCC